MTSESGEQGDESASFAHNANLNQPTESRSEVADPIELAEYREQRSEFSNTESNVPLVWGRQQLFPGILARLGWRIIITNACAMTLLVSAITVLVFLWFGGEENKHWRQVVIDGWIGQAVTLSTLAIRLAVSVQAGTAVAMLASVSIEHKPFGGVLLSEAPALSIARYVNTGPLGTLLPFLRSYRWSLNFLTSSTLVLAATALVSQFTSTLLLWDIRPGVVPGFPRNITTGIGISMEGYVYGDFGSTMTRAQNYWLASPPSYPTFAEWTSKPVNPPESIIDTGPSIRAFLPIGSESDRSTLLEFQGMASAFDARVVCGRPTIKDWSFIGVQTHGTLWTANYSSEPISFNGTLFPPKITGNLSDILRHDIPPAGYSFKIPIDHISVSSDPTFMIHGLPQLAGGLLNSLSPIQNSTLDYSYRSSPENPTQSDSKDWYAKNKENGKSWKVELGHSFLLVSASPRGVVPPAHQAVLDLPWNEVSRDFKVEERGPWLDFSRDPDPDNRKGVVSMTMCYDAIYHHRDNRVKGLQDFLVSAKRESNHSEPELGWDPATKRFKTGAIRAQLDTLKGASDGSAFVLNPAYLNETLRSLQRSPDHYYNMGGSGYDIRWYYNGTYETPLDALTRSPQPETYDFLTELVWKPLHIERYKNNTFEIFVTCHNCSKDSEDVAGGTASTQISPVLNTVFLDIMKETDNPALAWQALATSLMRMAYYDWLPTFDLTGNAAVTSMVPCQKPQYYKGFLIVMANLLIHLAFVTISSFWFFTRTQHSFMNNAWQAIAQIKAPDTELYLDNSTMLDDKTIKREIDYKWIRRRFNIRRNDEDDRVCLS